MLTKEGAAYSSQEAEALAFFEGCVLGLVREWGLLRWSPRSPEIEWLAEGRYSAMAVSGNQVVLAAIEPSLPRLFDLRTGESRDLPKHRTIIDALALDGEAKHLAAASGKLIRVFPLDECKPKPKPTTLRGAAHPFLSVALSADGAYCAALTHKLQLHLWSVSTGELLQQRKTNSRAVAFLGETREFAWLQDSSDKRHIWSGDVTNHSAVPRVRCAPRTVQRMTVSDDGRRVAYTSTNATAVFVQELDSRVRVAGFEGHTSEVWGALELPDGGAVSLDEEGLVIRSDRDGVERARATLEGVGHRAMGLSPKGNRFSCGCRRIVRVLEVDGLRELLRTEVGFTASQSCWITPNRLAVLDRVAPKVLFLDAESGAVIASAPAPIDLDSLFSDSGRCLAIGAQGACVFDPEDGALVDQRSFGTTEGCCFAWTTDGSRIVLRSPKWDVEDAAVVNTRTGRVEATLERSGRAQYFAFIDEGRRVVGTLEYTNSTPALIWDAADGRCLGDFDFGVVDCAGFMSEPGVLWFTTSGGALLRYRPGSC